MTAYIIMLYYHVGIVFVLPPRHGDGEELLCIMIAKNTVGTVTALRVTAVLYYYYYTLYTFVPLTVL